MQTFHEELGYAHMIDSVHEKWKFTSNIKTDFKKKSLKQLPFSLIEKVVSTSRLYYSLIVLYWNSLSKFKKNPLDLMP